MLIKEIFQVSQVSNKADNKVRRYDNKDSGEVNVGGKIVNSSWKWWFEMSKVFCGGDLQQAVQYINMRLWGSFGVGL